MKNFYIYLIAFLMSSLGFSQSDISITTSGGSFPGEKWVSITTAIDGGGTQVWGQGNGTQCDGAGLLTNEIVNLAPGTYYVNCYDQYDDSWDGTLISVEAYGVVIGDNGGVSPDDGLDTDASFTCEGTPEELEASFQIIVPTAPTCLVVSDLTIDSFNASSATISWTANNGETDWEIVVQADGTGVPAGAGTAITSNPHFELGLTGSTAYEVYVRANCGGGDFSDWQGPVDFTTLPSAPPSCPASFTATPDASCGNFDTTLSWDAVVADGYRITVGTTMGGNDILDDVDLGNVITTTVTGQTAGTTYYYTVAPYNVAGTQTGCTEQTYTTVATGCLCQSVPTSNDGNGISNVRLDITDFPSGDVTYVDHSGTPIDLSQGIVANCDITFETGFTYDVNIWIDFNDNLVLEASELVFSGEAPGTNPVTFDADFTVPAAAALGTHKMRIGTADSGQATPEPCYNGSFGVTLDFDVNIVATACVPATIAGTNVIENCTAGTFTVEVDVTDPGTATFIVGTAPVPITAGINTHGPFPNDTPVDLTVVDVTDSACNFVIGTFVNDTCPPPAPNGVTCTSGSPSVLFTEEFDAVGGWTGDINGGNDTWEIPDGSTSSGTGPDAAFSGANFMNWEASGNNTNSGTIVSPAINLTNAVDGAELAFYMHAFGADMGTLDVGVGTSAAGPFTTEFTWTGEFQTSGTDAWVPVGVDLSAYMGSVIYISFTQTGSGGTNFSGDMSIDLMTVTACGNFCFDPTDLAVSNVTSSGADVAWTANSGETAWEVAVQAAGTGTPAGSGTSTNSNPYSASGLTGQTDYEVYVRANCGGGSFSLWVGPVNFTTPCDAIVPDYTANMAVNVPDVCWDEAGDGEVAAGPSGFGASDWRQGRGYALGDSNALNLWQAVDREWLLSPTFDVSGGTYQLEINVAVTDYAFSGTTTTPDTMGSDDEVQLLVSTDGGATWTNLTTWNVGNQPDVAGTEYIEDLSGYTGNVQFAIWGSDGTVDDANDYDFHVGKFVVRTPPTCGDVAAITVSSVDDSSAQISWTDAEGETNWEIAVQTAGTGAPATANDSGTDTTSNPYSATGLTDATAYEVYVRADCSAGAGTNLGSWIGPVNFTTLPGAPNGVTCTSGGSSIIFTEEFAAQGGWTGNINGGDGNWEIPGDATSGGTGPSSEFSGAAGSYMNYEASGGTTATASAVSPAIDLTSAVDAAELSFYMHAFGGGMGTLNVGVGTSVAGPFTTEFTWSGELQTAETDAWVPIGVDLTAYLGSTIYIEFSHTGTGDFEGDMSIDFMRIETCGNFCVDPSGIVVSNVNGSEAQIAWTANGAETAWEVAVQPQGTGTPAGAGTATATNPYTETGLTELTAYEVYVRADCGSSTFSGWAGPVNFTTTEACPTVTGITLDSSTDTSAQISWTNGGGVNEAGWEIVVQADGTGVPGGAGTAATSPYTAMGLTSNTTYEVWVRADCGVTDGFSSWAGPFDFTTNAACGDTVYDTGGAAGNYSNGESYTITYLPDAPGNVVTLDFTSVALENCCDTLSVYDGVDTAATAFDADLEAAASFTATNASGAITIEFTSDGSVTGAGWEANYTCAPPPTCSLVTDITVSNISTTSADIGWTNGDAGDTDWEVAIQAPGTGEPAAADGSGTDTNTNPYSATGLTSSTQYEVYVRTDCGGGDLGDWAGPVNFTTEAACGDTVYDTGGAAGNYSNGESYTITYLPDAPGNVVTLDFTSVALENCCDTLSVYDGVDTAATPFNTDLEAPDTFTATNASGAITISFSSDGSVTGAGWEANYTCAAPPTCLEVADIAVNNIMTTTADISWTNGDPGDTDWEVAVQAPGTGEPAAADGSGTDTNTNPYTATGLTEATTYEVYVRTDCGGGDLSGWIGPVNFTTACNTVSLPVIEGFESGVPPVCWTSFRGTNDEGTGFDWTTSAINNSGAASAFVRYENVTNEAEDWLVTPAMDFSGATNAELSFYAAQQFTSDFGSVYTIRVSTTDTDHASFTTVQTYTEADLPIVGTDGFSQFTVDLTAYNGNSTVYVAFVMTNDDGDNFFVDDVLIWDNAPGTYTYTDGVWSPFNPGNPLDDIIVASGNLPIDADFTCNTMTVNPGAAVTVDAGSTLEATNGLFLESSSTSYSSLIRNGSVVGAIEYSRHVNINGSGTTGSNDLVSAPLTGQPFNAFAAANPNLFSNGAGTLFLFGPFSKASGSFVTWADTETATLDPGVGYRAATDDNGNLTFVGTDNTGDVVIDIQNAGPNNEEWNLIGNPYPSYLNVQDFLLHDVGGVVNIQLFDMPTAAIYGYDGSALNGWTIYNLATTTASTVITPGQGFFVSADATNAGLYDLEFTPAMRDVGTSDDFIVGRTAELTYLKLSLTSASNAYNTDFYFNANASEGFDVGYDAAIWGETAPAFSIYSRLVEGDSGEDLALQALKDSDITNTTIPLGVNANQGEQITFSIHESTLPANVKVYLDDTVKNTTTLLNNSDYVLTPSTDLSGTGRFFLRYEQDELSTIEGDIDQFDIFTLKNSDELVVTGQLEDNATLDLFDIQGRRVLSIKLDSALLQNRIDVTNINAGIYLATVNNNSQEITKKVIIE